MFRTYTVMRGGVLDEASEDELGRKLTELCDMGWQIEHVVADAGALIVVLSRSEPE